MTAVQVKARPTLEIPADAYDQYERLAAVEKKSLDKVLAERLTDCVDHNAVKGIWFGDTQRQRLESVTGTNVSTPDDVLAVIQKALRVGAGGVDVRLSPDTFARLRSRCFEKDFGKWLSALINKHLDMYTQGML